MTRCWISVASREHVEAAKAGGFCQFCHGMDAPVQRLAARGMAEGVSPTPPSTYFRPPP